MSDPDGLFELRMAANAEKALARLSGKAAAAIVEFILGPLRQHPSGWANRSGESKPAGGALVAVLTG